MRGRVYLPSTAALLSAARSAGAFPAPLRAHAVTGAVAAELPDADEEEREYAALTAAALDSVLLLGRDDPPVRVVAVVEPVEWSTATGADQPPSAVTVAQDVPLRLLAAVHVDSPDARAAVHAARVAMTDGVAEGDAERAVASCLRHELGWYAAQELDALLAELT